MDTRETALLLFVEMEKTKNFGSSLIRDTLNKYDYEDPREKAFLKRLTEGTLESLLTLDYVINAYSKTPTNKMKPLIRSLLRLSVYQILYMDTVPDSAACNEAVRLAKKKLGQELRPTILTKEDVTAKDVFDAVKAGDETAKEIAVEFGRYLGYALANLAAVLDPAVIVIGGGVSKAGEVLIPYIREPFMERAFFANRNVKFALATLGNDAGICGAAKLVLED